MPRSLRVSRRPLTRLLLLLLVPSLAAIASTGSARSPLPAARQPPPGKFFGLPDIVADKDKRKLPFYPGPKPPPRVGEVIKLPVPPPPRPGPPPTVTLPELQVVRVSPEGAQRLVAAVTAQFNQPMVPVGSLADLAKYPVPLTIAPKVEGKGRWLGTRTIAFERTGRYPFSTKYEVTIPAGTCSIGGKVLDKPRSWSFETPRLALSYRFPYGNQVRPKTLVALGFNQDIDAAAVHKFIELRGGGATIKTALVPQRQWADLAKEGLHLGGRDPKRTIVVRPTRLLKTNTGYTVTLKAGAPSAEGPLPGPRLSHTFRTYPPFSIRYGMCRWNKHRDDCGEGAPVRIYTTTSVSSDQDLDKFVKVSPKPQDLKVRASGSQILVTGQFMASSRYKVSVRAGVRDGFGQVLRRGYSATFSYARGQPVMQLPSTAPIVLEARHDARLVARVRNLSELGIELVEISRKTLNRAYTQGGRHWYPARQHPLQTILQQTPKDQVTRFSLKPKLAENALGRVHIPVRKALRGRKSGLFAVAVEAEWPRSSWWRFAKSAWATVLVQITDIGLTSRADRDRIIVRAARISTGEPLAGATIELLGSDGKTIRTVTTDKRGVAELPWKPRGWSDRRYLWAQVGDEFGVLPVGSPGSQLKDPYQLVPFVYTDRAPYKPGETVHVSGLLRRRHLGKEGGIEPLDGQHHLDWKLHSARGHEVGKGRAEIAEGGAFHVVIKLPEDMDLGHARFVGTLQGSRYKKHGVHHSFQVKHYRAPEFEVSASIEPVADPANGGVIPKALFFGDHARLQVKGKYYFGAPMAGASARMTLQRRPGSYRPAGHDGWQFGQPQHPWWRWRGHRGGASHVHNAAGLLGPDGTFSAQQLLSAGSEKAEFSGPGAFSLSAWVTDANRQQLHASTNVVVHRGAIYPGLKTEKAVVKAGSKVSVQVVAAGIDGKRTGNEVTVTLIKLVPEKKGRVHHPPSFGLRGRRWSPPGEKEELVATCTAQRVTPSAMAPPRSCTFPIKDAGAYLVRAVALDDKGRDNTSAMRLWAHGPNRVRWSVHEQGKVTLIADKKAYEPGETATLLIQAPRNKARGLLTLERHGILRFEVIDIDDGATVVKLPLDGRWVPNARVSVHLFSGRAGKAPKEGDDTNRPIAAHGQLNLPIRRTEKRIVVHLAPDRSTMPPGGKLALKVRTTDSSGKPIRANVSVFAVDEGVLALLGFQTPSPLGFFHRERPAWAVGNDVRTALLVERFQKLTGPAAEKVKRKMYKSGGGRRRPMSAPMTTMGVGGGGFALGASRAMAKAAESADDGADRDAEEAAFATRGPGAAAPTLRALFASTAFFEASRDTGTAGQAQVSVKMPDNATTFRIMAVVDDSNDRFGSGDSQVTLRQPVVLRASLPRFASLHDDFDAAVMVHNHTGKDAEFTVGGRAAGITWHDTFARQLHIAEGAAKEVHFRVRAHKPGRATFQFAARVKGSTDAASSDAVQLSIPINLPATLEAFATYGSTNRSVKQPIAAPKDAIPGFGGLNVSLTSTALIGMEDAVRYLHEYPYGCAEQVASRLLPIAALGDVLQQFGIADLKDEQARTRHARAAIKTLLSLQHYDGGFKYWHSSRESSRWITPWVTLALLLAHENGFEVPARTFQRANNFMWHRLLRTNYQRVPWLRMADTFALWVLTHPVNQRFAQRLVKQSKAPIERLYKERKHLTPSGHLWLAAVLHRVGRKDDAAGVLKELDSRFVEKAGTAHFAEAMTEDLRILMHSSDRTDAIAVRTLVEIAPQHPIRDKLVRGLMAGRIKGRWSTTQANAWALLAMRRYYDKFEAKTPDFRSQMWLGARYMGDAKFQGRTMKTVQAHVPIADVIAAAANGKKGPAGSGSLADLVLAKKGDGRMYYRIGLRYAPKDLKLPATEQGLTVMRTYRALDPRKAKDVAQQADGSWRIRAGTDVRVDLTLVVPTRAHYLVLDDPLPAGLEGTNPAFRTSGPKAQHHNNSRHSGWRWRWWWRWDHKEMRDDRVLLFADNLWAGAYSHSYTARATTIGTFVAGPARAEEMYAPETFGRTATEFVEVYE